MTDIAEWAFRAFVVACLVAAGVRLWLLGRRVGAWNAAEEARAKHQKYIGLDEYRARQQKQRYRDRVD